MLTPLFFFQAQTQNDVNGLKDELAKTMMHTAKNTPSITQEAVKVLDIIQGGGIITYILIFFLVVVIFLFFKQLLATNTAYKPFSYKTKKTLITSIRLCDDETAKKICEQENSLLGRLIIAGLEYKNLGTDSVEKGVESTAKQELYEKEKDITTLGIISGFAPMLGFLGTVFGMIEAFNAMSQIQGAVSATDLASGISKAMVTTAAGLITGIAAYVSHHYLNKKINKVVNHVEGVSVEFVELIKSKIPKNKEEQYS